LLVFRADPNFIIDSNRNLEGYILFEGVEDGAIPQEGPNEFSCDLDLNSLFERPIRRVARRPVFLVRRAFTYRHLRGIKITGQLVWQEFINSQNSAIDQVSNFQMRPASFRSAIKLQLPLHGLFICINIYTIRLPLSFTYDP
jgi:hypothetical protein